MLFSPMIAYVQSFDPDESILCFGGKEFLF